MEYTNSIEQVRKGVKRTLNPSHGRTPVIVSWEWKKGYSLYGVQFWADDQIKKGVQTYEGAIMYNFVEYL